VVGGAVVRDVGQGLLQGVSPKTCVLLGHLPAGVVDVVPRPAVTRRRAVFIIVVILAVLFVVLTVLFEGVLLVLVVIAL
jgi:hypothetical protein